MKVIKPSLTLFAMCIYKLTLSNGSYYYGATTNLGERIHTYLKRYRDKGLPEKLSKAFNESSSIKFQIVRFVNDRDKLGEIENQFLKRHVGLPDCLNTVCTNTNSYKRGKALMRIAKVDIKDGKILKEYDTPTMAAIDLGLTVNLVCARLLAKYPRQEYALRSIDKNGALVLPAVSAVDNRARMKPVIQYDLNMNKIAEFESMGEAARQSHTDRKGIYSVLNGKQKASKGFIYSFK